MCGIAGFVALHRDAFHDAGTVLERQLGCITRRGPDSSGVWLDPATGVALGHRRLAIVDLTDAGHQPMQTAGGRFVITYNGEIYNHAELRADLESQGKAPRWRGHSDTETLIAAFEAWGIEATLARCVGMFAFAVLDRQQAQLTLGRDRFGEKPLYYGIVGDGAQRRFGFGSELTTLSALPGFAPSLDPQAVSDLLQFGYISAPGTIHRGLHHLPPGCLLTLKDGGASVSIQRYWDPVQVALAARAAPFQGSDVEATDALEDVLGRAVRAQMVADVPLGAFLSGGIDSTAIVALMTRHATAKVKTFTIGFQDKAYDEAPFASQVARQLGTDHTEHYLTDREALDLIPGLPAIYTEPFGDSSQLPTLLVARLAREQVTVSLSGDAGDELFAGYNRYMFADRMWNRLSAVPASARLQLAKVLAAVPRGAWDGLGRAYNALAGRQGVSNVADKAAKAIRVMGAADVDALHLAAVSHWQPSPVAAAPARSHAHPLLATGDLGPIETMMLRDTLGYLPGDILHKVDRACMGVSLEGRIPFLDHRVFEFAWSLPMRFKVRDGKSKWLVRQLLERHLPPELIDRPKMGFAMPLAAWLRGPLRPWAEELLAPQALDGVPGLDVARVRAAWATHCGGSRNMTEQLWPLLSLQAWRRAG